MPAIDFAKGPETLSRYDVVGVFSKDQSRFVRHVGLFDEDKRIVEAGKKVNVAHMGPPLGQGEAIEMDVAGHIPLTADEIKKISIWIKKITDEYPNSTARQYVIRPPWKDEIDPHTNVRRYRRYSCAGFVLDGHRKIGIELLKFDENSLPDVDKATIESAYPDTNYGDKLLSYWGLEGNGPWKVVLAGYVLHALNRPSDQIRQEPYQAQYGDELF